MPNYSLEYLAGFFDGEGCISVSDVKGYPYVRVNVGQLERNGEVIYEFRRRWGGAVRRRTKGYKNPLICWVADGHESSRALADLLPHLRIKHLQAALAIEMNSLVIPGRRNENGTWVKPDPVITERRRKLGALIGPMNKGIYLVS